MFATASRQLLVFCRQRLVWRTAVVLLMCLTGLLLWSYHSTPSSLTATTQPKEDLATLEEDAEKEEAEKIKNLAALEENAEKEEATEIGEAKDLAALEEEEEIKMDKEAEVDVPEIGSEKQGKGDLFVQRQSDIHHSASMPLGAALQMQHNERQAAIVEAFRHGWRAYKKHAWGMDALRPLSKSGERWLGLGVTIVDSLDTMWLMGLQDEFDEGRAWVTSSLIIAKDKDVSVFETTIRVLGGLLSAYHLSKEDIFLQKAVELADRLMPCFKTASGIPQANVNLKTGRTQGSHWTRDSIVAEVGSIQLEFRDLSHSTGNPRYQEAVDHALNKLQSKVSGLVPPFINVNSGNFRGGPYTVGAMVDSYYEYLLKQWLQSGKSEEKFLRWYSSAIQRIQAKLIGHSKPSNLTFVGERMTATSGLSSKMDHLACYFPGVLALGAHNDLPKEHLQLASELVRTCYQMYEQTATGLSPDVVHFNTMQGGTKKDFTIPGGQAKNILRPETVESLLVLYRVTKNQQYREWGWKIFQAIEKYSKLENGGYASIQNVENPGHVGFMDKMESFFLAETLKYLFLLFSEDTVLPMDEWIFNTEAHPLPVWGSR